MSSAVSELEKKLLSLDKISYDIIDNVMRKIMHSHNLTAKELHNAFVSKHDSTPDNWIKKMKKINEGHQKKSSDKGKDQEGRMAHVELDQIERSIKNLRKAIKTDNQQLPAWVQSKITRAADYINSASNYLQSDSSIDEEISPTINPKKHRDTARQEKIRGLTKSSNPNEAQVAKSKLRPSAAVSLPSIKKEEISLVERILGEEKCGKGMYWCNTDKVCKPLPDGFKIDGQKKKPTEVGIGKPVSSEGVCNHTKSGKSCPVHGKKSCPMSEERNPKGPIKAYKTVKEIADKHKVSTESLNKQLKMGIKVESEHTTSKSEAKMIALQHLDEVPDYYTKLKKVETKKKIDEATRIQAQTGNLLMVTVSWRGRYQTVQMFFPQLKIPSRSDISYEIEKIYPGSKVITYKVTEFVPGQPTIQVSNSPSRNYLLNNKTIGEEVEIKESKKSEMPCNKPKAEAHGSGETGKSHVVKACEGGKEKLIRFGQKGVKGSPKKKGESEEYANRRHRFQARHAKNIKKGKMSAAYWANKVKW